MQNSAFEHQCKGLLLNIAYHERVLAGLMEKLYSLQEQCAAQGHKPDTESGESQPVLCKTCRKGL